MDWKTLPKITTILPYPQRDTEYDGMIEGHNDSYYLLQEDEIWDDEIPEEERHYSNSERVYLVYEMDQIFEYLLDCPLKYIDYSEDRFIFPRPGDGYEKADLPGSDWCGFKHNLVMAARDHAKNLKPIGYILEGDLNASRTWFVP